MFRTENVLGRQAEACFEAFLKQSKDFQILASNLQINTSAPLSSRNSKLLNNQIGNRTLGELDYIIRNLISNEIIHIELACKFYLFDENAGFTAEEKWIGPNRKDSLFDKLEKVKLKQFPLINSAETKLKLRELKIPFPTRQELCLKAFLFLPKQLEFTNFSEEIQSCIVGYYIHFNEFENEKKEALFAMPEKKEWLLPVDFIKDWFSHFEIKLKIEEQIQNNKSPLVYKKTGKEIIKLFVVSWNIKC